MKHGNRKAAFAAALLVVIIDQITKYLAREYLLQGVPADFIGTVVRFTLRFNRGAAFSLGWGGPVLLSVFTVVACVFLTRYMLGVSDDKKAFWLGIILGGAVGNLLDRLFMGEVTDFIDIGAGTLRWPTFNAADVAICVGGVAVYMLFRVRGQNNTSEKESEQ